MLNQTSEHAIRALLVLAQQPAGERISAERIARALGAPANYMAKTLNALVKQGLLSSSRGPAGGFALEVPADRITLAEVADAFRERRAASACLLGDRPCSADRPCPAHHHWVRLQEATSAPLRETTVADLLVPSDEVRVIIGGPAALPVRPANAA